MRSNLIAVISSASSVDHAVSACFLVLMLMGSPFRRKKKPEVGLRVYTKPAQVSSGSWSSFADSTDTVSGCARRCPAAIVMVWAVFISRSVSVLGSGNDAPTTLDSDAPGMPDDVDPAILCELR